MENGQAETTDATRRQINLNTCKLWCPFYEEEITVDEVCLADPTKDRPACPFKFDADGVEKAIDRMGRLLCTYSGEHVADLEEEA